MLIAIQAHAPRCLAFLAILILLACWMPCDRVCAENTEYEEDVIAFMLKGKNSWEQAGIPDLAALLMPDGQRRLPLLQLLATLRMKYTETDGVLSFQPDGGQPITLHLAQQWWECSGTRTPTELATLISPVTQQRDIFLPVDTLSAMLGMTLTWDEDAYAYRATTERALAIWKQSNGPRLFTVKTTEVPANLPSLWGSARPRSNSLDFFRLEMGFQSAIRDQGTDRQFDVDSIRQTLWGSLFNGQYKLQLREPEMTWGDSTSRNNEFPFMLDWLDWRYRWPTRELVAGDASLSLSNLILPYAQLTGVRFSGFSSPGHEQLPAFYSESTASRSTRPQPMLTGEAEWGSTVDLYVNSLHIASTRVEPEGGETQPDKGTWRFENIELPQDGMNLVRVIITNPQGTMTELKRRMMGSRGLLARNTFTYLGGVGTSRDVEAWTAQGLVGGWRMRYGLTDQVTIGGSAAYQRDYATVTSRDTEGNEIHVPVSSHQAGVDMRWMPFQKLLVSGAMVYSAVEKMETTAGTPDNDVAWQCSGTYYLSKRMRLRAEGFTYGPHFFNGQSEYPADRTGYLVSADCTLRSGWSLRGATGVVRDNTEGTLPQTFRLGFQSLNLEGTLDSSLSFEYALDRYTAPSMSDRLLHTLALQYEPMDGLTVNGAVASGEALTPFGRTDFLQGLDLPDLSLYKYPHTALGVSKILNSGHRLGIVYYENTGSARTALTHNYRPRHGLLRDMSFHTEIGKYARSDSPYLISRISLTGKRTIDRSLSIETRWEEDEWSIGFSGNFASLFSQLGRDSQVVRSRRQDPDNGGVHGMVFLDYNGNGKRERSEPGVAGITVRDDYRQKAVTDRNGYYLLPSAYQADTSQVFLDMAKLPAIYSPTHGLQTALLRPGSLTRIDFGIVPLSAITGVVQRTKDEKTQPLSGVRVMLVDVNDVLVSESYTANDGSYYLADMKPGQYHLRIDADTIPLNTTPSDFNDAITIRAKADMQEINLPAIDVVDISGQE